ncbi:MAG: SIS domain-containing protein [Phycisphaeraceae bacterium]|nr:SIS domain-containing protein [Phycisphaeraceae bacterium]
MNVGLSQMMRSLAELEQTLAHLPEIDHLMQQVIERVAGCLTSGHKLLACGNGGSAADAGHLTTELVCRFCDDRNPYPAICLNALGSDMTAISNDYGYDEVFARQVNAFGKAEDVLVVFTTSGNSQNIVRALQEAKKRGVYCIAFLGKDGGKCKGLADLDLIVTGTKTTARIQEIHHFLLHVICEGIEPALQAQSK